MRARASVLLALTAAVGAVAAFRPLADRPATPQRPTAPAAVRETESRIWFPESRPPALALPDGGQRVVQSLLNERKPLRYGEFRWNEDGVPPGPVWVRIDLAGQTMSVFRGGHEIGTAVILYGTDGKETPTGMFAVKARAVEHRSSLYDAEMPYMLRLTDDGVAIHASAVRRGSATHGCVGVPLEFARRLFDQVRRGDQVFIMRSESIGAVRTA